jgi:hypothetical protein
MQPQRAKSSVELTRLYGRDFFEWGRRNAETLRGSQPERADIDHLAVEIEDMGIRDLRALDSHVGGLLVHLLKLRFQPEKKSRPWRNTVVTQRKSIEVLLNRNPSLRRMIAKNLAANYGFAVRSASIQTGLAAGTFPAECPFTVAQTLHPEFLP